VCPLKNISPQQTKSAIFIVGSLFLLFGSLVIIAANILSNQSNSIYRDGITTSASVTAKRITSEPQSGQQNPPLRSFWVEVSFPTATSQLQHASDFVTEATFNELSPGADTLIKYEKTHPENVRILIDRKNREWGLNFAFAFGAIFIMAGILVCIGAARIKPLAITRDHK
jgi:hypothetical protein